MQRLRNLPASAPGRGDLLRFLALHGRDALAQGAELFGYQPPEQWVDEVALPLVVDPADSSESGTTAPEPQRAHDDKGKERTPEQRLASPMRYYRVLERTPLTDEERRLTVTSRGRRSGATTIAPTACPRRGPRYSSSPTWGCSMGVAAPGSPLADGSGARVCVPSA